MGACRLMQALDSNAHEELSERNYSHLPPLRDKEGRLTISGYMLTLLECPTALDFAAKTNRHREQYQQLLLRWKEAGLPDLGEWPKDGVSWEEWVRSLSF